MSVKSIGYQKGVNYDSKKFVVPDITINAGGQIVGIDSTNTPTNVVISGEIEDLSQTINKDEARLARLVDSESVIQTELDVINYKIGSLVAFTYPFDTKEGDVGYLLGKMKSVDDNDVMKLHVFVCQDGVIFRETWLNPEEKNDPT